jgi:hypothetical protein
MTIRRREFLEALAAVGAAALAGAGAVALPGCGRDDRLEPALRGFFADREAAREVGREVLALDPDAARSDVLVERLARRRGDELRALAGDPEALAELLRAQHRTDLAEDRVVVVRGWVLSQTEAWLLALSALPE